MKLLYEVTYPPAMVGLYTAELNSAHRQLSWWRAFRCLIGRHMWDGHTGEGYPTPRCVHCLVFHDEHQRKREEHLGFHDTVYFVCTHRNDWDQCPDCRH